MLSSLSQEMDSIFCEESRLDGRYFHFSFLIFGSMAKLWERGVRIIPVLSTFAIIKDLEHGVLLIKQSVAFSPLVLIRAFVRNQRRVLW